MSNWTLLCSDRQFRNCQSKRRSIIEYTKDLYPNRRGSGDASAFRRARWSGWEENKVSKTNSLLWDTGPSCSTQHRSRLGHRR